MVSGSILTKARGFCRIRERTEVSLLLSDGGIIAWLLPLSDEESRPGPFRVECIRCPLWNVSVVQQIARWRDYISRVTTGSILIKVGGCFFLGGGGRTTSRTPVIG